MIRKTGNRAFAALNRILSLPGSQALGSIDISVAQPTYDLRDSAKHELSDNWLFTKDLNFAAGGAQADTLNLIFSDPTDWDDVLIDGTRAGTLTTVNPAKIRQLESRDVWVWGFGIRIGTPGNWSQAQLYRSYQLPTSPFSTARQLLWKSQSRVGDAATNLEAPDVVQPLPWFFPADAGGEEFPTAIVTVSDDTTAVVSFRLTSALPGLFPFR